MARSSRARAGGSSRTLATLASGLRGGLLPLGRYRQQRPDGIAAHHRPRACRRRRRYRGWSTSTSAAAGGALPRTIDPLQPWQFHLWLAAASQRDARRIVGTRIPGRWQADRLRAAPRATHSGGSDGHSPRCGHFLRLPAVSASRGSVLTTALRQDLCDSPSQRSRP